MTLRCEKKNVPYSKIIHKLINCNLNIQQIWFCLFIILFFSILKLFLLSYQIIPSSGVSREKSLAFICARPRPGARTGDRVSRISVVNTRYSATRVPVHEYSRARPRDYIGVRTVGRWDERERIVVRTRRLPTELIGCSSERARRVRERDERRVWWGCETQKRHGRSAREMAGEAVERRDRIRRGQRGTSPGPRRKIKREGKKKGVRGWNRRVRGEEAQVRARGNARRHVCTYTCIRIRQECACVPHCG